MATKSLITLEFSDACLLFPFRPVDCNCLLHLNDDTRGRQSHRSTSITINGETLDEQGFRDFIADQNTSEEDAPATTPVDAFSAALATFEFGTRAINFEGINNSRFTAVPDTASAGFAGFVRINAGPTADLAAQIELTADFATGEITGEQTSAFFGTTSSGFEAYEGEVDVTYGRVGA